MTAKQVVARLWPFQRRGLRFILGRKRVLLADEMGMGKTPQAVVATELLRALGRVPSAPKILVVCKKGHKRYWADTIEEWSIGDPLPVKLSDGTGEAQVKRYKGGYFVVHWDVLRFLKAALKRVKWDVIIADESHHMKGRKSQRSKALRAQRAEYVMLLTGTPVTRYVDDLWAQLNFLDPERFRSYWAFYELFVKYWKHPAGWRVPTGVQNIELLKETLRPYYLRRLAKDHLKLPEPIRTTMRVDLEPRLQARLYRQVVNELFLDLEQFMRGGGKLANYHPLTKLARLRRVATSTSPVIADDRSGKLDTFEELIDEFAGTQGLVFTFFRHSAELVKQRLERLGVSCNVLMGGSPETVEGAFRRGDFQVLVCTEAAAEGYNFQNAHWLVFVEKPWKPWVVAQMVGRIVRPGLTAQPRVISLVSIGTVDAHVERVLSRKQGAIDEAIVARGVLEAMIQERREHG